MKRFSLWILCLSISMGHASSTLTELRTLAKKKGWTFEVGATSISGLPMDAITGLKKPKDWERQTHFWKPEIKQELPARWDWRDFGVVTPIKDQAKPQYCGSCWAFGTVASLESAIQIAEGISQVDLSEQQLVSCQPSYGTCSGGYFAFGFYLQKGANHETDFPYKAANVSCMNSAAQHEKIASWGHVGERGRAPTTDEIKAAIYKYGPVAVTVSASGAWSAYKGGVYNECNSNSINHIVALVGWDDTEGVWYLKNSHGTEWGEAGYMRIKYKGTSGNKCNNVGQDAAYVVYY